MQEIPPSIHPMESLLPRCGGMWRLKERTHCSPLHPSCVGCVWGSVSVSIRSVHQRRSKSDVKTGKSWFYRCRNNLSYADSAQVRAKAGSTCSLAAFITPQ